MSCTTRLISQQGFSLNRNLNASLNSGLEVYIYCRYNYVQHVQSAAPKSCRVHAPSCLVLTEHGLEIAQLVRSGGGGGRLKKPLLERLLCAQRCDHNIIKWKKAGNNGQGHVKESSSLLMMGRVVGDRKEVMWLSSHIKSNCISAV